MNTDAIYQYRLTYICFSVFLLFAYLGLSGCASAQQQPTTMDCITIDAAALKGVYKGKWKGTALNAADVYGEVEITVFPDGRIKGVYTGTASGDISGCVDASGNIQAGGIGSGGKITWLGKVTISNGTVLASGTWTFAAGKGTWFGQRQ